MCYCLSGPRELLVEQVGRDRGAIDVAKVPIVGEPHEVIGVHVGEEMHEFGLEVLLTMRELVHHNVG